MSSDFTEIMSEKSDKDLIRILTVEKDEFQPAALLAAKEELKRRDLTVDRFEEFSEEIEADRKKEEEKANKPLGIFWKFLAFLLPGLITLAFSGTFRTEGYDRKAKELFQWTLYGFGFYAGLITLIMIINPLSD